MDPISHYQEVVRQLVESAREADDAELHIADNEIVEISSVSRGKECDCYVTHFRANNFRISPHLKTQNLTFRFAPFVLNSEHKIDCRISLIFNEDSTKTKILLELLGSKSHLCDVIRVNLFWASIRDVSYGSFNVISINPYKIVSEIVPSDPESPGVLKNGCVLFRLKSQSVGNLLLKNCLRTGEYNDLIVKLDDGKEFKVHKMVLAFRSQMFKKMIDSDMKEGQTGIIHLRDVKSNVMREILNHVYDLSCDYSKSTLDVFRAAHLYELNELSELCKAYMTHNLSFDNFFDIVKLVEIEAYELKAVKDALNDFLDSKASEIIENKALMESLLDNMHSQSIQYLLKLVMEHNLDEKETVITFVLENIEDVLGNSEFKELILKNPQWSLEIFNGFKAMLKH